VIFVILFFMCLDAHCALDIDSDDECWEDNYPYLMAGFLGSTLDNKAPELYPYNTSDDEWDEEGDPTPVLSDNLEIQKQYLRETFFSSPAGVPYSSLFDRILEVTDAIKKLLTKKHHPLTAEQILNLTSTKIHARKFFIVDSVTFNDEGVVEFDLEEPDKKIVANDAALQFLTEDHTLTSEKTLIVYADLTPVDLNIFLQSIDPHKLDLEAFFYILCELKKVYASMSSTYSNSRGEWEQQYKFACMQLLSSLQGFCLNIHSWSAERFEEFIFDLSLLR